MLRRILLLLLIVFAPSLSYAQNKHVIDGKVMVLLPPGYHPSPKEFVVTSSGQSFSAPIANAEIEQVLARYGRGVTAKEYLSYMIPNEFLDDDQQQDFDYVKANLKNLVVDVMEIVPDEIHDPNSSIIKIPESQMKGMDDFCARFAKGFKDRWGKGAFHVFNTQTETCHLVNVYGAVVAVHVAKVDSYIVTVQGIDWSTALIPDYIDNSGFLLSLVNRKPASPSIPIFDFNSATPSEKFKHYRSAANTDDAIILIKSIKVISRK